MNLNGRILVIFADLEFGSLTFQILKRFLVAQKFNTDLSNIGNIFVIWVVLEKTVLSLFVWFSSGLNARVITQLRKCFRFI